jgi:tetratricopeptide (TPR) repeat protein
MRILCRFLPLILAAIISFSSSCDRANDRVGALNDAKREMTNGRYEIAIQKLNEIISHDPANSEALILRIECFSETKQLNERILDLKAMVKLKADSCASQMLFINDLVNAYDYLLQNDSAIRYQTILMKVQADCAAKEFSRRGGFSTLSTLLFRSGQYSEALATNDSAIAYGDTSAFINMIRASIFAEMGNLDSAIHYQTNAIERAKMDNRPYFGDYDTRANLYQEKEDLPNACADWQMALELGSKAAQSKLDSFCLNDRHRSR